MANTIVRYAGPSGLSLTLELFPADSDTLAGSYAMTEATNAKGWYLATVADALAGDYRCTIKVGSNVFDNGWCSLADDTETYDVTESLSQAPSPIVVPVTARASDPNPPNTINLATDEIKQCSVTVLDASGAAIDLESFDDVTMVFETSKKVDIAVLTNAQLTRSGNVLSFINPAELTQTNGTKYYALRLSDSTRTVIVHGKVVVSYVPEDDSK